MIGWNTKQADDINTIILNGGVDDDLEALASAIQRRKKIRDGMPVCPICGELMEPLSGRYKTVSHEHDGFTITREINAKDTALT